MSDPLICSPEKKPGLETANCVEQLDYITYLVSDLGARSLRSYQILELHRRCVEGIYPCGGTYRNARYKMRIRNSSHTPPPPAVVPSLVSEMVDLVNSDQWEDALERAAYALWRFNWIHPFAGGNGRTSRAIAYLVICMDWGVMLPGDETMPTILAERRDEYIDALQAADRGEAQDGAPDLVPLRELLWDAAAQQVAPIARRLARKLRWEAMQLRRRRAARKRRHAQGRRHRRRSRLRK